MPAISARANALPLPEPCSPADAADRKTAGFNLAALPNLYGMVVAGTCQEPIIPDGCTVVCDRTRAPKAGDFVVVFRTPESIREGEHQAAMKRLLLDIPPWIRALPFALSPDSTTIPTLLLSTINPPQTLRLPFTDILDVHVVIGMKDATGAFHSIGRLLAEHTNHCAEVSHA